MSTVWKSTGYEGRFGKPSAVRFSSAALQSETSRQGSSFRKLFNKFIPGVYVGQEAGTPFTANRKRESLGKAQVTVCGQAHGWCDT